MMSVHRFINIRILAPVVVLLSACASFGHTAIGELPAACGSPSAGSQAGLAPTLPGGGTCIAFSSFRRDGDTYISLMVADGTRLTRLTEPPAMNWDPTWSPDGKRIAFTSNRGDGSNWDIYVMDADGSNQTRLTDNLAYDQYASWSPDGTRIAYVVSERADLPSQIYVMDVDGSNPTRLTDCPRGCDEPAWSPDGTRIAFSSFTDGANGHFDIYMMAADGTNPTRLTNDPLGGSHPAWQP